MTAIASDLVKVKKNTYNKKNYKSIDLLVICVRPKWNATSEGIMWGINLWFFSHNMFVLCVQNIHSNCHLC